MFPLCRFDIPTFFLEEIMLAKLFGGVFLSMGLLYGGLTLAQTKTSDADCCAKKLACCAKKAACCTTAEKVGCCAKGKDCCEQVRSCCTGARRAGLLQGRSGLLCRRPRLLRRLARQGQRVFCQGMLPLITACFGPGGLPSGLKCSHRLEASRSSSS
jgi:hypothetical protein